MKTQGTCSFLFLAHELVNASDKIALATGVHVTFYGAPWIGGKKQEVRVFSLSRDKLSRSETSSFSRSLSPLFDLDCILSSSCLSLSLSPLSLSLSPLSLSPSLPSCARDGERETASLLARSFYRKKEGFFFFARPRPLSFFLSPHLPRLDITCISFCSSASFLFATSSLNKGTVVIIIWG